MYRSIVLRTAVMIALAAGSSACFGLENIFSTPTSPSDNSSQRSYIGNWSSQALSGVPGPSNCGNLKWNITSQQGNQVAGNFEATCAGGVVLTGTASGTMGDTIVWVASGKATQGSTSCDFNLNGTGTFQGTSTIVISYSGTVCSIPVSGTETIKR
jgi:hypothetical protein